MTPNHRRAAGRPRPQQGTQPLLCNSYRCCAQALWFAASAFLLLAFTCAAAPLREVIVVFKTHFDIGYTDMASNVVQRYRTTMIDQALDVVDQSRSLPPEQQFVWTIPGWPMSKIAEDWPGQTPQRRERIARAFKEGRFVVHALPFSMHTELLEPEDLVRSLGYASRLCRGNGLPLPRDAKMTDVPCHSWIIPTVLKNAGVDFLHLGCNSASSSPKVPRLFWWEGPDGSRLLTMYSADGYGTGLVPPPDWPYDVWLALIHTGDNHGPPQPAEVKKVFAEAAEKLPGVKVRIGRLSDFADSLLSRSDHAPIPVVRADMPDTWIHGPLSDPQGARQARNVRPLVFDTEALCTQMRSWGVSPPDFQSPLRAAAEQSLLYGEHTWGGALYWIFKYSEKTPFPYGDDWRRMRDQGKFARNEASWEEHTGYAREAAEITYPLFAQALQSVGKSANVNGERVVVYNPLPWKRSGVVEDSQYYARDIPAMGYRTFTTNEIAVHRGNLKIDQAAGILENDFLKITLDTNHGVIRSVIDKRSGRELTDNSHRFRLGQYLYERFDARHVNTFVDSYIKSRITWALSEFGKPSLPTNVPYAAASPSNFGVRFRASPVEISATMTARLLNVVTQHIYTTISLPVASPWFEIRFIVSKPADPWPEAGWICLPINAPHPRFRIGRQSSVIDPASDIIPGANRHLYAVNTAFSITDQQGRGAAICPIDHALISLGEPGCWRYSLDYVPEEPVGFVNLFNNQWTTNFRFWNQGCVSSRIRIWALSSGDNDDLIKPALEARHPLQATSVVGAGGASPPSRRGVEVARDGVLVTAFTDNPDGTGVLLRLWESVGRNGKTKVRLPDGFVADTIQPVDLRGTPLGAEEPLRGESFIATLRAFAPASYILTSTGNP